jgi:glucosamine--fructose-6-phosphate aminotransferase (isomerizing)
MLDNRYLSDILSQPQALQDALDGFDGDTCRSLHQDILSGRFDRIVLSGMGGSSFATYPAWLELARHGLPAWTVETSELLHYAAELITPRTLLWLTSQSGGTAEVLALLDRLAGNRPAFILATTNEPSSPLAQAAGAVLQIHAGVEATVSTKTYLNTLAVSQLASLSLSGEPVEKGRQELAQTREGLQFFLADLEKNLNEISRLAGYLERLFLLGRGPSLASAEAGALILKESTKFPATCISAGQFRHGPIELADEHLTLVLFEGQPHTAELNRRLGQELAGYGATVLWVGGQAPTGTKPMPMPASSGIGLPLAEMLPVQLLSLVLARQNQVQPGTFRYIEKVTRTE